jgi:hypothetical protein
MTTTSSSNERQTELEMDSLKKRPDIDEQQDVQPIGYVDNSGVRRSVPGDDDSAWLKTPPFTSPTSRWTRATALPALDTPASNYVFLPSVDVQTRRLLNVWIRWSIGLDLNETPHVLSLVPQGKRDTTTEEWYTIGVVDPALTANTPIQGMGSRSFYQAELRATLTASATDAVIFTTVLTFDVAIYSSFRVGVADALAGGTFLDLDYSFSD